MDKSELIITTAKEIFLKIYRAGEFNNIKELPDIDKAFKALTKTVNEAFTEISKNKE